MQSLAWSPPSTPTAGVSLESRTALSPGELLSQQAVSEHLVCTQGLQAKGQWAGSSLG